jgi:hypothetical protein
LPIQASTCDAQIVAHCEDGDLFHLRFWEGTLKGVGGRYELVVRRWRGRCASG